MRPLIDTHVFLWYVTADSKLPATFLCLSLMHRFLRPCYVDWQLTRGSNALHGNRIVANQCSG